MLTRDVVVLDRADALTLMAQAAEARDALRRLESVLSAAMRVTSDDLPRRLYADVRTAGSSLRWVEGALIEATA